VAASPKVGCSNAWSMAGCGPINNVVDSHNLVMARKPANPSTAFDSDRLAAAWRGRRGNGAADWPAPGVAAMKAFTMPRWLEMHRLSSEALVVNLCRPHLLAAG